MTKAVLITWLAGLSDDAPELNQVALIRDGGNAVKHDEGRALTITMTANRAGVSRPVIYRAASTGALKLFRPYPNARPRVTEGELSRWMATRTGVNGGRS